MNRGDPVDRQADAYRSASESDWATDELLVGAVVHEPGSQGLTPEEWETLGWDDSREAPKTLDEAKAALAARIADPDAPDDESVANAYDDLEA